MPRRSATGNPRKIVYAEQARLAGKKRQDIWTFKGPAYPSYPTEKNLDLLKTIVACSSNPGDLVLDCFAGSGTTLVACERLARQGRGVEISPGYVAVALERLALGLKADLFEEIFGRKVVLQHRSAS